MSLEYDSSFIETLFSTWNIICSQWDDKKSHDINDRYCPTLLQTCRSLADLGRDIQVDINRLADEVDAL